MGEPIVIAGSGHPAGKAGGTEPPEADEAEARRGEQARWLHKVGALHPPPQSGDTAQATNKTQDISENSPEIDITGEIELQIRKDEVLLVRRDVRGHPEVDARLQGLKGYEGVHEALTERGRRRRRVPGLPEGVPLYDRHLGVGGPQGVLMVVLLLAEPVGHQEGDLAHVDGALQQRHQHRRQQRSPMQLSSKFIQKAKIGKLIVCTWKNLLSHPDIWPQLDPSFRKH